MFRHYLYPHLLRVLTVLRKLSLEPETLAESKDRSAMYQWNECQGPIVVVGEPVLDSYLLNMKQLLAPNVAPSQSHSRRILSINRHREISRELDELPRTHSIYLMTQSPLTFGKQLTLAVQEKRNPVCVGLDPRLASLPPGLMPSSDATHVGIAEAFEKFCNEIVDVVSPLVPVVKPQVAFFEQYGPAGMFALQRVIAYASSKGLLVIADAKRGDIGTTAEAYAQAFLGSKGLSPFGADCLTVNPYLGEDSLTPFVVRARETSTGIFVLVKTSNPGSGFIQDLQVHNLTISERIADWVQSQSLIDTDPEIKYGSIGAVVGATYPTQLASLRARMPNAWLLIPGYGAQGGSAKEIQAGFDTQGLGAIVNNSRGIIFAHQSEKYRSLPNWQMAVEASTCEMIQSIQAETTVKNL